MNIDKALSLGKSQLQAFKSTWPEGFYDPIKQEIKTLAFNRKSVNVGKDCVIDHEAIYARMLG